MSNSSSCWSGSLNLILVDAIANTCPSKGLAQYIISITIILFLAKSLVSDWIIANAYINYRVYFKLLSTYSRLKAFGGLNDHPFSLVRERVSSNFNKTK